MKIELNNKESEAIYKLVKEYEKDALNKDDEYYDDYDEYKEPIEKKIINSIIKKIIDVLPKDKKREIDKDFLRQKYHTFNNEIDEKVYSKVVDAFERLRTIEIEYFDMESAEFIKRKIDVYYKNRKYVIGYCHLRKGIRKFRTSKIASAKLTNGSYNIPESFDKKDY